MLLKKFYNEEKLVEECFYDSSNIKYSMILDKQDDYKVLTILFNNGSMYVYSGIDVKDYLLFRDAESQGKALYEHISKKVDGKPKYEFRRVSDVADIQQYLNDRLKELEPESVTHEDNGKPAEITFSDPDNFTITMKDGKVMEVGSCMTKLQVAEALMDYFSVDYTKKHS